MSETNGPTRPVTKPVRAGLIFFVTMISSLLAITFLGLAWDVIQTDILRSNPHRTVGHAISLVFLFPPILVFFFLMGRVGFALVAVIVVGKLLFKRYQNLNFAHLCILLAVSVLCIVIQDMMIPTVLLFTATPEDVSRTEDLMLMTTLSAKRFLPGVVLGWLIIRHRVSKLRLKAFTPSDQK